MVESNKESKAYVFDVDGTLMPARQIITEARYNIFKRFIEQNDVYILTGSDYEKTNEQLLGLQDLAVESWQCGGAEVWRKGERITPFKDVDPPQFMLDWFGTKLIESKYTPKVGNHIEQRNGMINFSILGRGGNIQDRAMYKQWDAHKNERENLAREFNYIFGTSGWEAMVAGDTGLDIFKDGVNKGVLYDKLKPVYNKIVFFGDHCLPGQNDYPFVRKCQSSDTVFHVEGPAETFAIIESIMNEPV